MSVEAEAGREISILNIIDTSIGEMVRYEGSAFKYNLHIIFICKKKTPEIMFITLQNL